MLLWGPCCGTVDKSLLIILAFSVRALVPVLAALLLVLFPVNLPGKAAEDGLSTWALDTHRGDLLKFQTPYFHLAYAWLLCPFGK